VTEKRLDDSIYILIRAYADEHDFECVDNYRAFKVGDAEGEARFDEIASNGCCGSHRAEVEIDGEKWVIGFNHGH